MDRLRSRLSLARRTWERLDELAGKASVSDVERDAAIQRFEYCFEATWKAAQLFLSRVEGLHEGSPKGVIRACARSRLLREDEARQALVMADDRNLTVHTYNEELAKRIFGDLAGHSALLARWISAMEHAVESDSRGDV